MWGYFSIDSSGLVHEFADSQFGHVFAHGPDRESARRLTTSVAQCNYSTLTIFIMCLYSAMCRAMVVALKELEIRGEIRTTMEYIVNLMQVRILDDSRSVAFRPCVLSAV